jgi:putative hydrolase of the HAD superfamily
MPKVVFFDLDETLASQESAFKRAYRATAECAAQNSGIDADELERSIPQVAQTVFERAQFFENVRRCRFGGRDILWGEPDIDTELADLAGKYRADVWTAALASQGVEDRDLDRLLGQTFTETMINNVILFAEVAPLLARVHKRIRMAVVTNGMETAQRAKLRRLGIEEYFEVVVASAVVGEGKPSRSIFEHALARMSVKPADGVMVGDSLDGDIAGAVEAGLVAVWVNRDGRSHDARYPKTNHQLANLSGLEQTLRRIDSR